MVAFILSVKGSCKLIKNEEHKQESLRSFLSWLAIYILVFAIVFVASLFCVKALSNTYRYYPVHGTSMQPTINPTPDSNNFQDGVFVKVTHDVEINDIVIIDVAEPSIDTIIKRVIAKDGDLVTIAKNDFGEDADQMFYTYVIRAGQEPIEANIEKLSEEYIGDDRAHWSNAATETQYDVKYDGQFYDKFLKYNTLKKVTVNYQDKQLLFYQLNQNEVFFLGDHRSVSRDARSFGTVPKTQIVGSVIEILNDAQTLQNQGLLWWVKFKVIFGYYWSDFADYFAWNV